MRRSQDGRNGPGSGHGAIDGQRILVSYSEMCIGEDQDRLQGLLYYLGSRLFRDERKITPGDSIQIELEKKRSIEAAFSTAFDLRRLPEGLQRRSTLQRPCCVVLSAGHEEVGRRYLPVNGAKRRVEQGRACEA